MSSLSQEPTGDVLYQASNGGWYTRDGQWLWNGREWAPSQVRYSDDGLSYTHDNRTWYSQDGRWMNDGRGWGPSSMSPSGSGPVANTSKSSVSWIDIVKALTIGSPAPGRRYVSWGSQGLGEVKWLLASFLWSAYAVGALILGFQSAAQAFAPPPPTLLQPDPTGGLTSLGLCLLWWLFTVVAGFYAFRLWSGLFQSP